jgi:hypothetical protein
MHLKTSQFFISNAYDFKKQDYRLHEDTIERTVDRV